MIRWFRDKKTQQFFAGEIVKEFSGFRKAAERKLTMLDNASGSQGPAFPTRKPVGDVACGSGRAAQHQDQRSVEDVFSLEG